MPWGMVGAVIAVAFSDLPVYFVNAYSASREGLPTINQDALLTLGVPGSTGSGFVGKIVARFWIPLSFPFPALTCVT